MKTFKGRHPDGPEWSSVFELDVNGQKWIIYMKPYHYPGLSVVKIVLGENQRSPKANYWTKLSDRLGRLIKSEDMIIMKEWSPDLYAAVDEVLGCP